MFFVLSKILFILVYPLSLTFILLLAALGLRRVHTGAARLLFYTALFVLYLPATEPVSDLLLAPLERPFESPRVERTPQAIVVLSGMVDLERSSHRQVEFYASADRFVSGLLLAQEYPGALLIFSGGSGSLMNQAISEARLLESLAIRFGIAETRIRLDVGSRNTYENAVATRRILADEGVESFVLVTTAAHMRRALGCFHKVGLSPVPYAVDFKNHFGSYNIFSPVPRAGNLRKSTEAIHEYTGLLAYKLRGYL